MPATPWPLRLTLSTLNLTWGIGAVTCPLLFAGVTEAGRSRLAGLVMAFGGFGGALLPWLTGRLSEATGGSLSRGFLVPIAGLGLMAALYTAYLAGRRGRSSP
ncbi:MAG: hypothetical protein ACE5GX_10935 [Thermoanaerobaculia bacterium]